MLGSLFSLKNVEISVSKILTLMFLGSGKIVLCNRIYTEDSNVVRFRFKGLFTPNDSVAVTLTFTGGTFDLFHRHCDEQNGLHTHFACPCNGIAWCERAFRSVYT